MSTLFAGLLAAYDDHRLTRVFEFIANLTFEAEGQKTFLKVVPDAVTWLPSHLFRLKYP